ncbi:MAG: hypothetical protein GXO03_06515 [Aquificae bacterium]|nr:hypothetical protein [Aquificota bacterium]
MRSRAYFVQLRGLNEKGEAKVEGALYLVAVPPEKARFKEVPASCYSEHYVPEEDVLRYGRAYAVGLEFEPEEPERYRLKGFNEEDELFIFEEGVSMKEGLKETLRVLMDRLARQGYDKDFETVRDLGAPSEELLRACLLEVIKER